jgi:hypothetical protein
MPRKLAICSPSAKRGTTQLTDQSQGVANASPFGGLEQFRFRSVRNEGKACLQKILLPLLGLLDICHEVVGTQTNDISDHDACGQMTTKSHQIGGVLMAKSRATACEQYVENGRFAKGDKLVGKQGVLS